MMNRSKNTTVQSLKTTKERKRTQLQKNVLDRMCDKGKHVKGGLPALPKDGVG